MTPEGDPNRTDTGQYGKELAEQGLKRRSFTTYYAFPPSMPGSARLVLRSQAAQTGNAEGWVLCACGACVHYRTCVEAGGQLLAVSPSNM